MYILHEEVYVFHRHKLYYLAPLRQCRFYMIRQGRTLGGVDWVSRLDFWLEMSHAVKIRSITSASLTLLISATILSFQHIFPYNFGSSLRKQACYILLKTTENKVLLPTTFIFSFQFCVGKMSSNPIESDSTTPAGKLN